MDKFNDAHLGGVWYEDRGKIAIPKMKVDVNSDNRVILDLVNMSKAEQNEIIEGVKSIYGDDFIIESILGGVRVYAPSNS